MIQHPAEFRPGMMTVIMMADHPAEGEIKEENTVFRLPRRSVKEAVFSHALRTALVRCLTAVIILATTAYVTYTFWRASTPYGDVQEAVRTGHLTMTLAAYLSIAAIFILFEFIALLWSMTRTRVRDEAGSWKEDTGRGLSSFVFIFGTSYLSFILYRFIPGTPEILFGLKGALDVYGSMHNVLLGLCAAGVASCLVRKYF